MSTLIKKVELADRLIKGGASIGSLVLPTAALIQLGRLPDHLSGIALIVLPAVTLAVILAIMILGKDLARIGGRVAAALFFACAALGAVSAFGYAITAHEYVIEREVDGFDGKVVYRDIKPRTPSPRIVQILGQHGNSYDAALWGPDGRELSDLMRRYSDDVVAQILSLIVVAQLLLVAAIVGGAWWLVERDEPETAPRANPGNGGGD